MTTSSLSSYGAIIYQRPKTVSVHAIYFLLRRGKVVYVGQSRDLDGRIANHDFRGPWDKVAYIPLMPMSLSKRMRIERFFIGKAKTHQAVINTLFRPLISNLPSEAWIENVLYRNELSMFMRLFEPSIRALISKSANENGRSFVSEVNHALRKYYHAMAGTYTVPILDKLTEGMVMDGRSRFVETIKRKRRKR